MQHSPIRLGLGPTLKPRFISLAVFSLAAFISFSQFAKASEGDCERPHDPRYVYSGKVVEVYDGDTVYMDIDLGFRTWLHREPLRLWGVNTKEVKGKEKKQV